MFVKFLKNHFDKFIFAISLIMLTGSIVYLINANPIGEKAGNDIGVAMGRAVGSLEGLTKIDDGLIDGKEEGLSAKDVTINDIKGRFNKTVNLQVLVAGIKEHDHLSFDGYNALYLKKGTAVFTVDLGEADVKKDKDNVIKIILPMPEAEFYPDENQTKLIAEYPKGGFKGDTTSGSTAKLNSEEQIDKKIYEAISADSNLMQQAMTSAEKQVSQIAEAVNVKNAANVTVVVEFGKEIQ